MFHRSKRFKAFTTGCLASLVVFGYPSQLLAQSNTFGGPIQGVTSTSQEAPTTAAQVNDVMTGLAAGVGIGDLIEPKPDPIREYTVFLVDFWDALFASDYLIDSSSIQAGEWLTTPTGVINASNENGESVQISVTLSLEILPSQWSEIDQESIDLLSSVSARMGIAWTTMTNGFGESVNVLSLWMQWDNGNGPTTLVHPLNTISQAELDLFEEIIPYMDDFFDDPLNYNIENYDPSTFGLWSRFRSTVKLAVIAAVSAVAIVTVGTVVAVLGAATVTVALVAITAYLVVATVIAATAVAVIDNAVDDLRDELADEGFDVTNATNGEVIELGKIAHVLGF